MSKSAHRFNNFYFFDFRNHKVGRWSLLKAKLKGETKATSKAKLKEKLKAKPKANEKAYYGQWTGELQAKWKER